MESIGKYALIFLGGGLGSCLRFGIATYVQDKNPPNFPWGTFSVNIAGAFIIGLFMAAFVRLDWNPDWRLFVAVGILGGFTTFSSLCYDALQLLEAKNYTAFTGYILGTNIVGFAAAVGGVALMRALLKA